MTDELIEILLGLMRIKSPSGHEDAIAEHVERFLRDRSSPSRLRRRPRTVVASYGTSGPEPAPVVIAGHLDTVPENKHPEPHVANGIVHGLGASDMKSGLAVMLALAERAGNSPGIPFTLVFYDCEEIAFASNGLRPLLAGEPELTRAGLAILMEPTAGRIEAGCNGTLHARVIVPGVAAHSARPWTGQNAVHAGAELIARIAAVPPRRYAEGPAEFVEVVNVTQARATGARNVIPDSFELNVNLRFPPDRAAEEAEDYIRTLIGSAGAVDIFDLAPAAPPRLDAPLAVRFRSVSGAPVTAKQGWTDVAQFASHGVPALNYGPGIPEVAHKVDEHVPVEAVREAFDVLSAFLGGAEGAPGR